MKAKLSFKLRNCTTEIDTLHGHLDKFARMYKLSKRCLLELDLAAEELFTNIVSYGFKDDQEHQISVQITCEGGELVLRIEDDGVPFNPFGLETPDVSAPMAEREIGGLGIHLVRTMMDEYLYQRQINKNVVTLVKLIEG